MPSGQYAKVVEGERPNELLIRRFAQSGRAMSGESVRLEDVALSDRFCVFESFELASLTRCSYKDPAMAHNVSCKYATTESATLLEGNRTESKDAGRCTFHDEAWRRNCLPCARDRQLSWSKERQTVVNGSAVCGIEVAGPCAGLIIRSYILVDEVRKYVTSRNLEKDSHITLFLLETAGWLSIAIRSSDCLPSVLGALVPLLSGYFFSSQCTIDGFSPRGGLSLDASCCDAWPW